MLMIYCLCQVVRIEKRSPKWPWLKDEDGKSPRKQDKGRSEDLSEDLRQNKQHSWLSPVCIGQAQGEEKHIKGGAKALCLCPPPGCAVYFGMPFPVDSEVKASACNAGDPGSIPGLGRSPGEGNGNPLQYSCLENLMDGGAWWATVHGVAKSQTRLSDFTFIQRTGRRKSNSS